MTSALLLNSAFTLKGVLCLITGGAFVMGVAIFKTKRIIRWLNRDRTDCQNSLTTTRSWWVMVGLMVLFLGGYSLAGYLVSARLIEWLPLLTGTVFFFGALFVLFSVSLYAQTLYQLIAVQRSYRDERDRAAEALDQLKQTQMLLVHNEKMLSLGQLSAGIAHEINNPASFIHGNIRHLEQYTQDLFTVVEACRSPSGISPDELNCVCEQVDFDYLKEDYPKILGAIKRGTQRIKEIVLSMRSFARLDESQYKFDNLTDGLNNAWMMIQNRIDQQSKVRSISIDQQYDSLPLVNCDHSAINQVFFNLLNNAVDALENALQDSGRDGKITIRARSLAASDQVEIAISDNGDGVPAEIQHKIFDPFFTTKPIGKGTGMGLAICHKIVVDQHHGSIRCQSGLSGSTFIVTLPIDSAQTVKRSSPRAFNQRSIREPIQG